MFPDKSFYSLHRIALKLGRQLDHEVVQRMLFRGYSMLNFDSYFYLFIYLFFFFFFFFFLTIFRTTFVSGSLLQFKAGQVETWWTFRPRGDTAHIISRLQ